MGLFKPVCVSAFKRNRGLLFFPSVVVMFPSCVLGLAVAALLGSFGCGSWQALSPLLLFCLGDFADCRINAELVANGRFVPRGVVIQHRATAILAQTISAQGHFGLGHFGFEILGTGRGTLRLELQRPDQLWTGA